MQRLTKPVRGLLCRAFLAGSSVLAIVACSNEVPTDTQGATLTLLSVDTLVESESLFVGRPRHAVRGPNGTTFVIDGFARRVVEFDSLLRPVRTFGRSGQGPGEFVGPSTITLWGQDTMAVMDLSGQAVNIYRLSTGRFIRRMITPGVARTVASTPNALLLGTFSSVSGTAAGLVVPGDTAVLAIHTLPAEIRANPLGMQVFPLTWVAGRGDSIALMFTTSDRVFFGKISGDSLISVRLPSQRRGTIPDTVDALIKPVLRSPERLLLFPAPDGVQWRSDGMLLAWHRRFRPIGRSLSGSFERADSEVTATAYLTILDRERNRACADIEIPTDWAEDPSTLFADSSSFFVLGHSVGANSSRPTLELRRYSIPFDSCRWLALKGSS